MIGAADRAAAQSPAERPDLYQKVQDTAWIFLVEGNDTLDRNLVSGAYDFTMQHDSTCLTSYYFTEPWHNGRILKLLHWQLGRSANIHEDLLSLNSRTEDFTVHAGDTVSFMRWYRIFTVKLPFHHYFISRDTLFYVVELVEAHDSARYQKRVAVIDSFGVMPRSTPGAPRFFSGGPRNVNAVLRYTVPTSLNGKRVFMRMRLHAGGSGDYYFTRTDDITTGMSLWLRDPEFIADNQALAGDQFWKPVADHEPGRMATIASKVITIERRGAGDPSLTIRLGEALDLGHVSIVLHDAAGATIATLYSGVLANPQTLGYDLSASGTFFISIVDGNRTLHTEKILLTK
jgi:hypothetical protein